MPVWFHDDPSLSCLQYIVQGTLNERGNLVVRPQTTLKDITITPDPLTESDEGCKRH